ncbi:glycoside hydrolase family 28 protein [Massilia sp. IC2-477]|uniref:glycoside hydrolase family 28 protein n=1 Tax=Massilia sp. IC2-477 TaxID=2887198 RepID=UPI001D10D942|nr:glycoside hydrolase family 28 protein [Massilia sp. IC2-477]MCC2957611.1 glycoside hydrolase family 28 protein [Massilia sp. IC2-477]
MKNPQSFSARRRALMQHMAAAGTLAATNLPGLSFAASSPDPWRHARRIDEQLSRPMRFPERDFPITGFGARPCALVQVEGWVEITVRGKLPTPAPDSPDSYPAIGAAIAAAHAAGGGRVLIPAGNWYCKGPIVLRSNVHVHLASNAHVFFSADPRDFARDGDFDCGANGKLVLSRWQGNDCLNFSPMVYARGQKNIALTGADWTSILNGQAGVPFEDGSGRTWWGMNRKGARPGELHQDLPNPANAPLETVAPELDAASRARIQGEGDKWRSDARYLPALSEAGVPPERRVFGLGHFLRPSMIEFVDCSDVLMQGYQVTHTPFWIHHPVNSRNIRFSKVRMDSMGPNSDGFDPESCDTILVDGCLFNTGDDCIAIKSGKNRDSQYGPTRNVVIRDCIMNSGHGGITLGSEMSGGIEHVYAERIEFRNAFWATNPLGTAIRMKTNMNRGGFLRHFYVRDVQLPNGVKTQLGRYKPMPGTGMEGKVASTNGGAIVTIDCDYAPSDDSVRSRPPVVEHVHISNLRAANVKTADGEFSCYQAVVVLGPVAGSFNGAPGTPIPPLSNITISDSDFGRPRAADGPWFAHHVRGLKLSNVRVAGKLVTTSIDA